MSRLPVLLVLVDYRTALNSTSSCSHIDKYTKSNQLVTHSNQVSTQYLFSLIGVFSHAGPIAVTGLLLVESWQNFIVNLAGSRKGVEEGITRAYRTYMGLTWGDKVMGGRLDDAVRAGAAAELAAEDSSTMGSQWWGPHVDPYSIRKVHLGGWCSLLEPGQEPVRAPNEDPVVGILTEADYDKLLAKYNSPGDILFETPPSPGDNHEQSKRRRVENPRPKKLVPLRTCESFSRLEMNGK